MKKYFFLIVTCFLMAWITVNAQTVIEDPQDPKKVTVTGLTPGKLAAALAEKPGLTSLTLNGTMDARDFKAIRDSYASTLASLNLTGITEIVAYVGLEGTSYSGASVSYPKNELPVTSLVRLEKLNTILPPPSLTSIGMTVFNLMGEIGKATIDLSNTALTTLQVASFAYSRFANIDLPNTVSIIWNKAFEETLYLETVTLPESLQRIGDRAFYYSKANITLPEGAVLISGTQTFATSDPTVAPTITIPENAKFKFINNKMEGTFTNNANLTGAFKIPEGVTEIGEQTFQGTNITKIDIPSTVTSINKDAFNTSTLQTVIARMTNPDVIEDDAFTNVKKGDVEGAAKLYVPAGALEEYKTAHGWKDFMPNIRVIGEDAEESGIENFNDIMVEIGSVETITLAATLKTEGDNRTIKYSIEEDKDAVATLSGENNSVLTIKGLGTAEITAIAEGDEDYKEAKKTITLTVVSYDWLQAPAIAVHGSTAKVVGPEDAVTAFAKFYIGTDEVTDFNNDNGADISSASGTVTLKATSEDGKQVIRLVITIGN